MLRKSKKTILAIMAVVLLSGLAMGYYLYNKRPIDVRSTYGIPVISKDLYKMYSTDSLTAGKKYTGKVVQVTGNIKEISTNASNENIVLLETGTDGASINCTLEEKTDRLRTNQIITIKGIVSGIGQGDADLGIPGDVYLSRCYTVNTKH